MTRDEVLCELLAIDAPAPEILLEEDGDFCLDWQLDNGVLSVSISSDGGIAWAYHDGKDSEHGTDIDRANQLLIRKFQT
jgi:hypothetical protein